MKRVLFLCTGNSARSQIAEALLRQKAGVAFDVHSAGTKPKGVNPLSVQVMQEIGIDISSHESKDVAVYSEQSFDWVVTVCDRAKEACPVFPAARYQHWDIQDPSDIESFRKVRQNLAERIDALVEEIGLD